MHTLHSILFSNDDETQSIDAAFDIIDGNVGLELFICNWIAYMDGVTNGLSNRYENKRMELQRLPHILNLNVDTETIIDNIVYHLDLVTSLKDKPPTIPKDHLANKYTLTYFTFNFFKNTTSSNAMM